MDNTVVSVRDDLSLSVAALTVAAAKAFGKPGGDDLARRRRERHVFEQLDDISLYGDDARGSIANLFHALSSPPDTTVSSTRDGMGD
jgi:hypothetical protein